MTSIDICATFNPAPYALNPMPYNLSPKPSALHPIGMTSIYTCKRPLAAAATTMYESVWLSQYEWQQDSRGNPLPTPPFVKATRTCSPQP